MLALALTYRGCSQNISSGYIQGHDAWINGSSIQVASTKELQKASDKIRTNLDLDKKILDNDETKLNRLNEQTTNIKWQDPSPFTNYQIYRSVVTDESSSSSSGTGSSGINSCQ